ncbi:type II toxin-antitoxin system RelB/DinJ family antitoxin [Lactobacillus helveticus]|uniref:type II toxin-antitoxin system RelB/DinJ family antitoxin n=1 Tax=Lactobacillus helveticus TaxID=1587 RepID=UPI000AAD9034|nr:type II toxin-antitoxin system RelB/DinJ family antitoxin [Lactobacillus helveticus]
MDYKDQTSMQKTQLSISVDEDLAKDVQEKLEMLGLDQSDFLIGLLTNIANNKKLPFSKLTNEEEEKAILAAKLSALTTSWGNIPELNKEFTTVERVAE